MNSNYPERWLNDRRIKRLSDAGHRFLVIAMTYAVANKTDGLLDLETVDELVGNHGCDREAVPELISRGLLMVVEDGWFLIDFPTTQTSVAQANAAELARMKKNRDQNVKRYIDLKRESLTVSIRDSEKKVFSLDQTSTRPDQTKQGLPGGLPAPEASWETASLPGAMAGELFQVPEYATTESGVNGAYSR